MHIRAALCAVLVCSTSVIGQELIESSDYPNSLPGPNVVQVNGGCFLAATGSIAPGDVDWVSVAIPFASARTVVDIDFAGGGQSFVLVADETGGTYFGMSDGNNGADELCGLGAISLVQGSSTDSVVDMGATPADTMAHVGVTGANDFGFTGSHSQTFDYEVWVYAGEPAAGCTSDLDCDDGVDCTWDVCDTATGTCANEPDDSFCDNGLYCDGAEMCDAASGCVAGALPCAEGLTCDEDAGMCVSESSTLVLDVRPGVCPNWVNARSRGVLHVGLMGSDDFEVGSVDPTTLLLWRSDGVGEGVAPWSGGASVRMVDVGGSDVASGGDCACYERRPDGTYDLLVKFRIHEMVRAMQLDDLTEPTLLEVTLEGYTKGGEPFAASDCVNVIPPG